MGGDGYRVGRELQVAQAGSSLRVVELVNFLAPDPFLIAHLDLTPFFFASVDQ